MKKLMLITLAGALAGLQFFAEAYDPNALNAKAVSVHWRYHKWHYSGGNCCDCSENTTYQGSLMVHSIRDGVVTKKDTIYDQEQGFAQYPQFDLTGTRIAFYRKDRGPAGPDGGGNCVAPNGGKSFVSVINFDGTGQRDLCELPGRPGKDQALAWPAGEWIYYSRPTSENKSTGDIWKVHARTGETERVCDLGLSECHWRRFSMNVSATKVAFQVLDGGCGINSLYNFPPAGCNLDNAFICKRPGCNIAVSTSGSIVGSYFDGWHNKLYLNGTDPANPDPDGFPGRCGKSISQPYLQDLTTWTNGDSIGVGAEHIGWAKNSDKWVLQNVGWYQHAERLGWGSNQIAASWINQVAIRITDNPKIGLALKGGVWEPPGICYNNTTGDMWIDDPGNNPDGTKYEDLQGVWHEVAGATPVHKSAVRIHNNVSPIAMAGSLIRVRLPGFGSWKISVSTADGRVLSSQRGVCGSHLQVATAGLSKGIYLLNVSTATGSSVQRFMVR